MEFNSWIRVLLHSIVWKHIDSVSLNLLVKNQKMIYTRIKKKIATLKITSLYIKGAFLITKILLNSHIWRLVGRCKRPSIPE